MQTRPFGLHRCQAYEIDAGVGDQVPGETISVRPRRGSPAMVGCEVAISTAGIGAIGPTRPAYAVAVPLASVARSASPSVLPTSRETSVYVWPVAPRITAHPEPVASQRYHW